MCCSRHNPAPHHPGTAGQGAHSQHVPGCWSWPARAHRGSYAYLGVLGACRLCLARGSSLCSHQGAGESAKAPLQNANPASPLTHTAPTLHPAGAPGGGRWLRTLLGPPVSLRPCGGLWPAGDSTVHPMGAQGLAGAQGPAGPAPAAQPTREPASAPDPTRSKRQTPLFLLNEELKGGSLSGGA